MADTILIILLFSVVLWVVFFKRTGIRDMLSPKQRLHDLSVNLKQVFELGKLRNVIAAKKKIIGDLENKIAAENKKVDAIELFKEFLDEWEQKNKQIDELNKILDNNALFTDTMKELINQGNFNAAENKLKEIKEERERELKILCGKIGYENLDIKEMSKKLSEHRTMAKMPKRVICRGIGYGTSNMEIRDPNYNPARNGNEI